MLSLTTVGNNFDNYQHTVQNLSRYVGNFFITQKCTRF